MLTENGEFILFQLPDCLPGEPQQRDEISHHKGKKNTTTADKPTTSSSSDKKDDDLSSLMSGCALQDFSEGYIGKLQVHKSGKTRLILGNVALDINMGTPTGFLQVEWRCCMYFIGIYLQAFFWKTFGTFYFMLSTLNLLVLLVFYFNGIGNSKGAKIDDSNRFALGFFFFQNTSYMPRGS